MPETETSVSITVNGNAVEARPGELVIDAAERNGVYIPRFCYHHRMEPVGMCRMCLVEVDTGRGPALQPSCMLTVAPDMVVETESPVAKKAQDGILEFLLINHPLDCPVCDKGGECPLQDHTVAFGPGESRFVEEKRHYEKPISISENVFLDRERCILCDRCTRFAKDVAGDTLIHFQDRGNGTQVNTFPEHPFASYFSGNTVQICPVGALTAKPYRFKARPWDLDVVESTCRGCSVGCRIVIDGSRNEVLRYVGVDSDPVNWSWLCDKGRFGFEAVGSEDRLAAPLVRGEDGELAEARWADALDRAARALKGATSRGGAASVAVIGGSRLTNESAYAWAKLMKGVVGTDNVDAQLADGLPVEMVLGLPRATIDSACAPGGTVLVLGSDPKDELAVLFLRLRDAVTRGKARIVEVTPAATSLSDLAAHVVTAAPGTTHEAIAQLLAGEGELASARAALDAGPLTVLLGRGSLAESSASIEAAANAVHEAFPEARFLSGLRRSNVHGALDLGLAPGVLPGQVSLDEGRAWFSEAWGSVPAETGLDTEGILRAAADGQVEVLVLLGADPLADVPDRDLAAKALERAGMIIAVDTFPTASVAEADVVLAAAGPAEVDGTTTNLEGRVSTVHRKVTPPGTARPDWMIAAELAHRLGADLGFSDEAGIWAEIERLSSAHAGMTLEAIVADPDGQVIGTTAPAPGVPAAEDEASSDPASTDSAGESETDPSAADQAEAEADDEAGVPAPVMLGRPSQITFAGTNKAPSVPPVDAYSLRLVIARRLYDQGTQVAHAPSLAGLAPGGVLTANPFDLDRLGVGDGDEVRVSSAHGSISSPVRPDTGVPVGTAVLRWGQDGQSPAELVELGTAITEVRVETTR